VQCSFEQYFSSNRDSAGQSIMSASTIAKVGATADCLQWISKIAPQVTVSTEARAKHNSQ